MYGKVSYGIVSVSLFLQITCVDRVRFEGVYGNVEGNRRRERIMEILKAERKPVSGTEIAGRVGVSRQVVVQDIALLRTSYKNIVSTNRGYLLYQEPPEPQEYKRVVKVRHQKEDIERELNCVVDVGGYVLDVIVEHEIYGQLIGNLSVYNRADVKRFIERVEGYQTKPLTELTQGVHFHTIGAKTEEILEAAVNALVKEGFWCG